MEFKIVGILVWLGMCFVGLNACFNQLNLPSDSAVVIGCGGLLFMALANVFLIRYAISHRKTKEDSKNENV